MQSKEEIEKAYWQGYIQKQNETMEICKQCKYMKETRKLENKLNQLNTYILTNGVNDTLKTATQIKAENQNNYLHQKEIERLKSIIDYLESREQKLIEKLEEDIENSDKGMDTNIILIKEYYKNKKEYAQEILKILKGENNE